MDRWGAPASRGAESACAVRARAQARFDEKDMDERVDRLRAETAPLTIGRDKLTGAPPVRHRARWRWLALLVLLLIGGWLAWRELRPATTPDAAPAAAGRAAAQGPAQPVGTATAARGDVRVIINGLGTVTPLATVTVKTQIAGQLQQIGFTEGQMVHKGDFLAQIDPRPYQALLEQYQGQLAKDQATLKQAQVDLIRYQTLLKQDSIARQQAEDQIYVVQQDEGAVRTDQALIDTQKLNLVYCHITAPTDGRVGLRQVDAGNYVQTTDANGLVVLTQLQPISVLFSIAEDDLPSVLKRVHDGATLPVALYDRANVKDLASGTLSNLDNEIDTTTGMVKLRAMFANADESLFPSQFVNARLLVDTLHGVVTVPVAAIQRGVQGTYVYVVGADSTVAVRVVTIGVTDGDAVEVTKGLAAGDRVVIDGSDRLRDGAKVSLQNGAAGGAAAAHPAANGGGQAGETAAPPAAAGTGADQPTHTHHHQQNGTSSP
jgi:multidrug efflux system membrane fusion protein